VGGLSVEGREKLQKKTGNEVPQIIPRERRVTMTVMDRARICFECAKGTQHQLADPY